MKLKYILPVATIASVATAVTPLAVSCGKNTNKVDSSWEKGQEYKPMNPMDGQIFSSNDDLTVAYRNELEKNLKIWSDEKVNEMVNISPEIINEINSVSYTTTKVGQVETDTEMDQKYFRLDFNITINAILKNEAHDLTLKYENREIKVTNFPVFCEYMSPKSDNSEGIVYIEYSDPFITADKQWTINMPELVHVEEGDFYDVGDKNIDFTSKTLEEEGAPEFWTSFELAIDSFIHCSHSNYFSKMAVEK